MDDGSGTGKHAIAGDGIGDTAIPWPGPDFDNYPFIRAFPPAIPSPVCDIQMSQAIYTTGDTGTAQVFRLANPGPDPLPVELKIWLGVPGIPPISVINAGADGSVILPAGFDQDFGPLDIFLAAGAPLGSYEFSCRFLDPVTGELLAEDLNPFEIQ